MTYIFSYGTLQHTGVQQAVFGRKLRGRADVLTGFQLSRNKAYGSYPILTETRDASHKISGTAYELEDGELKKADIYEGKEYRRILVDLESGKKAWLYVAA